MNTPPPKYRYKAFISYSHQADRLRAAALQKTLERIARPWYRIRSMRVFRDDTDLSVAPGLESEIYKALEQSEWFVLLASPQSAGSEWIAREVQWWLAHREIETILLVKTEGDIQWDPATGDFDWQRSPAIPVALKGAFSAEPLFLDLSSFNRPEQLDADKPEFRAQVLKIAARLLGKSPVDLESEDIRQVRRNKALLIMGILITTLFAGFAGFQWQVADQRGDQLEKEALRARSSELAASGRALATSRTPDAAFVLARHALTTDSENPESVRSAWSVMREHLCVRTFQSNRGAVSHAVFSADGTRILMANEEGTAQLWEIGSEERLCEFMGHTGNVTFAMFSPDESHIVTAGDHTARVWDAGNGEEIMVLRAHTGEVLQAVFSPDGSSIATASRDGTARIWSGVNGAFLTELGGHPGPVRMAVFDPDGARVLTISQVEGRIWDVAGGKVLVTLRGHRGLIRSAEFSPDGRRVVTASDDRTARVWDASNGALIAEFTGHRGNLVSARFSPDGDQVVTASRDRTARVFETATGKEIAELRRDQEEIWDARFSPDGGMILTTHGDFNACLWEVGSQDFIYPEMSAVFRGHKSEITSAVFSQDSRRILTASSDGTARVWDVSSADVLSVFPGESGVVSAVAFGSNGRCVRSINGAFIRSWDLDRMQRNLVFQVDPGLGADVFSPDGRRVLTSSTEGVAVIWDTDTGEAITSGGIEVGDDQVIAASFTADGKRVVVTSGRIASVWDVGTATVVAWLKDHVDWIESAEFSPDGRRVVTASQDGTAKIWDARTGAALWTLEGHKAPVSSASFSADGRKVVTASHDRTSRVWDTDTGRPLAELNGHRGVVISAQVSPNGRFVATASQDKTARLWDAETGVVRAVLRGHRGPVNTVAFSPDSRLVVTCSRGDNVPKLWDAGSGKLILALRGHKGPAYAAAFSPDCRQVATGGEDGTVRVWGIGRSLADPTTLLSSINQRISRLGVRLRPDQCELYFSSETGTKPDECPMVEEYHNDIH